MQKLLAAATGVMLMAGSLCAWAQMAGAPAGDKEITCDVQGEQKKVKSADECKKLGGTVVPSP